MACRMRMPLHQTCHNIVFGDLVWLCLKCAMPENVCLQCRTPNAHYSAPKVPPKVMLSLVVIKMYNAKKHAFLLRLAEHDSCAPKTPCAFGPTPETHIFWHYAFRTHPC